MNIFNDGKEIKPLEKLNRHKLAATAADKLNDYEFPSSLVESGLHKTGGRRSTGTVIRFKMKEKKDDEGEDKVDDSFSENDTSLD